MVLTHSSAYSWLDTKTVQVEVPSFRFLFFLLFYFIFLIQFFFAFQLSVCVVYTFACGF